MTKQEEFEDAIFNNDIVNVKLLLKNKKVNPSNNYNWAIYFSSQEGYLTIVKILLQIEIVNPSDLDNRAFRYTNKDTNINIATLLWNDKRVKDTLQNIDNETYDKIKKENIKNKIKVF